MITAEKFSWRYLESLKWAIRDISFIIKSGEQVCILGDTGSGKSTFSFGLMGFIPHRLPGEYKGTLQVLGQTLENHTCDKLPGCVAVALQEMENQFLSNTVRGELTFGMENLAIPEDQARR